MTEFYDGTTFCNYAINPARLQFTLSVSVCLLVLSAAYPREIIFILKQGQNKENRRGFLKTDKSTTRRNLAGSDVYHSATFTGTFQSEKIVSN